MASKRTYNLIILAHITIMTAFLVLNPISKLSAASIIDQSFNNVGANNMAVGFSGNTNVENPILLAQTFTVGIAGIMDRVDIALDYVGYEGDQIENMNVFWEIRSTSGGMPTNTILSSGMTTPSEIRSTTHFGNDLYPLLLTNQQLYVSPGDMYSIIVYSDIPTGVSDYHVYWLGAYDPDDLYLGGKAYYSYASFALDNIWWTWTPNEYDFYFETYVNPVPIPGAIWLLGSAFLGLIGLRKSIRN